MRRQGVGETGSDGRRIAEMLPGMRSDAVLVVKKKVRREQPDGSRSLLFQLAARSGRVLNPVIMFMAWLKSLNRV